jgi:hypothetical protein
MCLKCPVDGYTGYRQRSSRIASQIEGSAHSITRSGDCHSKVRVDNVGKLERMESCIRYPDEDPHALREANAYYSPEKKALLFGYFPASAEKTTGQFPGGMVFTCLSHDVVAHETTHALLDGFHRRFLEATNPDVLAFHEAFADIVALFQHFSFPDVLRHQIARTRGDLGSENLLAQMATQVGNAIGNYGALRDAIGKWDEDRNKWVPHVPEPTALEFTMEPHDRGATGAFQQT